MRDPLRQAVSLGLLLLCVPGLARPAATPPRRDTPGWAELGRARDYFHAIHSDSALPIAQRVLRSPEAARDPALALAARQIYGSSLATMGRAREAEPVLREVVREAEASGDSAQLGSALRYLAYSLGMLGRSAENEATTRHLLQFALARRDSLNEAYARLGLAYRDLLAGRFTESERGYLRAIPLFRRTNEGIMVRNATVGLCRCYSGQNRLDDARRCYLGLEAACRDAGDVNNLSSALNNLGAIEQMTGDLAAAAEHYRAAYAVYSNTPSSAYAVTPAANLALVEMEMGHLREAEQVLKERLAITRDAGYKLAEVEVLDRLAALKVAERRYSEASDYIRQGLALIDSIPPQQLTGVIVTLGRTLVLAGRVTDAIAVLEPAANALPRDAEAYSACELRLDLSNALLRAGRNSDALLIARLARLDARRGQSLDLEFRARVREGLALLRLGRVAEAQATLEAATTLWEANRDQQRDPEAREYLSTTAHECVSGLIETYLADSTEGDASHRPGMPVTPGRTRLADSRCARVFGVIERFKARTLRERMLGPWQTPADRGAISAPVALEEVQRSLLRDGELLIESFLGPSAGVIVAVTTRECRIARIPTDDDFRARLLRLSSLASKRDPADASGRFVEAAGRRIGETVLAPVRDLLSGCTRVIVAPDDELGVIPWALVAAPGRDPARSVPLVSDREVVLVPSASIFADLRRRTRTGPNSTSIRVLAVAGSRVAGAEALPGAAREVRWLDRHFAGVDTRRDARTSVADFATRLGPYDVLHLAAHSTLDDQYPWRSGIRLGGLAAGEDDYLRAQRIASLRLNARLAVLSSCESASGRITSGEGVQSLSAAFISAGVTATVATLWPVSDRTTERLMQTFYLELESGRTVAAALRAAQLDIRGRPGTRHPFYWAGFVVLGDGDVHVPLRSRPPFAAATAAALGMVLAGLAFWGSRRRRA